MGQPVVHFEIIGQHPAELRTFYGALFGWEFDTSGLVSDAVSEPSDYGFIGGNAEGIPGGVGGGAKYESHVIFYVGVPDVEAALQKAEQLGATRVLSPSPAPSGLVVGHFADAEGNVIGLAARPESADS